MYCNSHTHTHTHGMCGLGTSVKVKGKGNIVGKRYEINVDASTTENHKGGIVNLLRTTEVNGTRI